MKAVLMHDPEEIQKQFYGLMKDHIGRENRVQMSEICEILFKVDFKSIDVFKKIYYWTYVRKMISRMRHSGELFVINNGGMIYVLRTIEELNQYIFKVNVSIKGLKQSKKMAKKWVTQKMWRKLK